MRNQTLNKVPRSYEDMYCTYFQGEGSLARTLVRQFLPYENSADQEDLVSEAYSRGLKGRILEKYDEGKANFGGVVFFLVRSACSNYLRAKKRDPLGSRKSVTLVESFSDEPERGEVGMESSLRPELQVEDKAYRIVEAESLIRKIEEFVKVRKSIGANKRDRSLLSMVQMIAEGLSAEECADRLNVTVTTVKNWTSYLASKF